jgi:hypothetical protein
MRELWLFAKAEVEDRYELDNGDWDGTKVNCFVSEDATDGMP